MRHVLDNLMAADLGILCMSKNEASTLMWSHYADSHRGALLIFDEGASCFRRNAAGGQDAQGALHLRDVMYGSSIPSIDLMVKDDSDPGTAMMYTKSAEWSYEEEVRLVLPLALADRVAGTPDAPIYLVDCPTTALGAVVVGCTAAADATQQVRRALARTPNTGHVKIGKAVLCDDRFGLHYVWEAQHSGEPPA